MPLFAIYLFIISTLNGIGFVCFCFQLFHNISLFWNSQSHQKPCQMKAKKGPPARNCSSRNICVSEKQKFSTNAKVFSIYKLHSIQSNMPSIPLNHGVVMGSRWILYSWPFLNSFFFFNIDQNADICFFDMKTIFAQHNLYITTGKWLSKKS